MPDKELGNSPVIVEVVVSLGTTSPERFDERSIRRGLFRIVTIPKTSIFVEYQLKQYSGVKITMKLLPCPKPKPLLGLRGRFRTGGVGADRPRCILLGSLLCCHHNLLFLLHRLLSFAASFFSSKVLASGQFTGSTPFASSTAASNLERAHAVSHYYSLSRPRVHGIRVVLVRSQMASKS